ncbi:uridine kinase family protein [Paenibacillus psychroresistens]|nr:uridine kinase [Paenibacillus psychroresistens]
MITSINNLLDKFHEMSKRQKTLVIGIDGGGAAGKSTLARKFQYLNDDVTVVHMDDFYYPTKERKLINHQTEIGGNWDWNRVLNQVLVPIKQNENGYYQIYDWDNDILTEWHTVPIGGIVIIEGCYSLRKELSFLYDVRIWIESPQDIRLERGVQRDGGGNRDMWEKVWLPDEDRYFEVQKPADSADIVIDGTGHNGDISKFEVNIDRAPENWLE